jgi:hypothetical protein
MGARVGEVVTLVQLLKRGMAAPYNPYMVWMVDIGNWSAIDQRCKNPTRYRCDVDELVIEGANGNPLRMAGLVWMLVCLLMYWIVMGM